MSYSQFASRPYNITIIYFKMKKHVLLIICLFAFSILNAQTLGENELVGTWKVVHVLNKENNGYLKEFMKSFETAIIEFRQSHEFKLTSEHNSPIFKMFTDKTKNSMWKYSADKKISIGNSVDHFSLLKIFANIENNKIIFTFEETPIRLEVQKM